ncbi:MAG: transglycosylase domain-containing protein, partial [Firmicutes bacterium]|nr:transglycosylase domain-containing protein [Bacillota bacterium]
MDYSSQANSRKRVNKEVDQERLIAKIWLNVLRVVAVCVLAAIFIVGGLGLGAFKGIIDSSPIRDSYDITDFTSYIHTAALPDESGEQADSDNDGEDVPEATPLEVVTPIRTSIMRSEVSIDDIPLIMQQAVIAIEDSRFYEHNGIDIEGILRSGVEIVRSGDMQGGSTLTQQVVKNLALTSDTSLTRKFQEWYMALQYEYQLTKKLGHDAAKRKILETYLNYVNFGNGNYGVQSACHYYFNKDVQDITISEAAVLAGVLNAPSFYDPVNKPQASRKRQLIVLQVMHDQGYLTDDEYTQARIDPVFSRIQNNVADDPEEETSSSAYTYFEESIINQVIEDLMRVKNITEDAATQMVYHGGLNIYSTQDAAIQSRIDYVIENAASFAKQGKLNSYSQLNYALSVYSEDYSSYDNFGLYNLLFKTEQECYDLVDEYRAQVLAEYNLNSSDHDRYAEDIQISVEPQMSVILMDPYKSYILGMSAGRGKKTVDMALNRATDTVRQPGSTFKVISAFAPAIDGAGRTASTVYDDTPLNPKDTEGWVPKNWWVYYKYFGFSTIRQGIARSMNLVAARCLIDIGPQLGYEYATEHFGITTLEPANEAENYDGDVTATMALGGLIHGVTNLELSNAFAAIANHGVYTKATFYTKVFDHDGNLILDKTPEGSDNIVNEDCLDPKNAWLIENMMQDVVGNRFGYETGRLAKFGNWPIAAKSGTSESSKDYWFVGWTPYYLCSFWQGYDMMQYSGAYKSLEEAKQDDIREDIWKAIMADIHQDLEYKTFDPVPDGFVSARICQRSGLLARSTCSGSYVEYFVAGTEPTRYCDCHVSVYVCQDTGLLANPDGSCYTTLKYGTKRDYELKELEELFASDEYKDLKYDFKVTYVDDYVPHEYCPGHDWGW